MSIKYGFFDNQLIGVDELKDITKGIQSNGISIDKNQMAVSDLNQFYEKVFTTGVVPDTDASLKVSASGTTITVSPGTAYFDNGTFITLDAQEDLIRISGSINYVYAVSDREKGEAHIELFTEEKSNDDEKGMYYVPLAEIATDGAVTDKRVYATSSLAAVPPANASGNYFSETITLAEEHQKEGETRTLRINANPAYYKYLELFDGNTFVRIDISDFNTTVDYMVAGRKTNSEDYFNYLANVLYKNVSAEIAVDSNRYAGWNVSIISINESGIKLRFTSTTRLGVNYTYCPLTFKISLIRKENITDETTVTIE